MKEINNILRTGIIVLLLVFLVLSQREARSLRRQNAELLNAPADTVVLTRKDTVVVEKPVPVVKYLSRTETVYIHDTVTREVVYTLPREVVEYRDSSYFAVISGIEPRLDRMETYKTTVYQTITKTITVKKPQRWGLGLQAGVGLSGAGKITTYLGFGAQCNIISW